MNILKKFVIWLAVISCICAFGLFVYPTMYKYDKLEQKYPVQINRITGETKVLTENGWVKLSDPDDSKSFEEAQSSSQNSIKLKYGDPNKVQKYEVDGIPYETWFYDDLLIRFQNGKVTSKSGN